MRNSNFEQRCYELYQFTWLINHGYSLEDIFLPMLDNHLSNFTEYAEHLRKNGFDGKLFLSEQEFHDTIYQNAKTMRIILPKNMFEQYTAEQTLMQSSENETPQDVLTCLKDMSIPANSKCAKCCIHCNERSTCQYRCAKLDKWKTRDEVAKNCVKCAE